MEYKNICDVYCYNEEKVHQIQNEIATTEIKEITQLFKILSEENRVKIIFALSKVEELCVCDLSNITGMTTANTSHHLRNLHAQKLVKFRKEGRLSFYSLNNNRVNQLLLKALSFEEVKL